MHHLNLKDIEKQLKTSLKNGLGEEEAKKRLSIYGKNIVKGEKRRTLIEIIKDQFKNTILWMLVIAGIISLAIGEELEGIAIFFAVFLSVGFGSYLEYKADESLEKLKKLTEKKALVVRDGKIKIIEAENLVVGDVIIIQPGAYIGADAIIIEGNNLRVDESHLTGESIAVAKRKGITDKDSPLAERFNVVFAGSYAISGEGKAVVIATGKDTELGKIAKGLSEIEEEKTPLMKNLDDLGKKISAVSLVLVLIVFLIGYFEGRGFYEMFIYGITLAVAAVPEGLTAVLTIMLTLSVIYMARNNALVKKITSVEAIGNIDILAVDKTGTLTEGKLALSIVYENNKVYSIGEYKIGKTIEYSAIANLAKKEKKGFVGDDIDVAIMRAYQELGGKNIKENYEVKKVYPFDSEKKYMRAVIVEKGGEKEIMKGAYEIIASMCNYYFYNGKEVKLSKEEKEKLLKEGDKLAMRGFRVIAVSYKKGKKIVFVGFLGFIDKEKPKVKETIEELKKGGIKTIMLTGDNIKTAKAIAERVGIEGKAVEWKELEKLDDKKLYSKLKSIGVIARSTPESKLRIVEVMAKRKHIIAVTGDGINDALALKKAHVGVVMGKRGTEVSKEVADLILLDDNFYTLVKAIKHGRNLIKNILSFIKFQFTANASALIITLSSLITNISFPLTPLQLLWINIIMDGPPALSLGFEKPHKKIMEEKPRKGKTLIGKRMALNILSSAIYISVLVLYVFITNLGNVEKALAMSFNLFVFFQLFNTFNSRSFREPFYRDLGKNRVLLGVVFIMAVLQIAINYLPITRDILNGYSLSLKEWSEIIILSLTILLFEEAKKKTGLFNKP